MGNLLTSAGLRRAAVAAAAVGAVACAVPAAGGAATVIPVSRSACHGTVRHDPKGAAAQEPNRLDYRFTCNGGISAYTILIDQDGDRGGSIDDFAGAPSVFETDGLTPSPTESLTCEGVIPSNGINCNTGARGSLIDDHFVISGTVDPVQAYCEHLPTSTTNAPVKPGTPAVPRAKVQLIVTDYTGAQDGPFTLPRNKPCPAVPDAVPSSSATS